MRHNLILESELERAQKLLQDGEASKVIKRLTSILSQIERNNPRYEYESVIILRELSRAAAALGENEWADLYIKQATKHIYQANNNFGDERTELFLNIAETLLDRNNLPEAMFFAESALHGLADSPEIYELDDIASALRRYATIARRSGSLSSAYLALTVALLLLQEVNGLESIIATEAAMMTTMACEAAADSAVGRIGYSLLKRAA